jgi:hypothetical protein
VRGRRRANITCLTGISEIEGHSVRHANITCLTELSDTLCSSCHAGSFSAYTGLEGTVFFNRHISDEVISQACAFHADNNEKKIERSYGKTAHQMEEILSNNAREVGFVYHLSSEKGVYRVDGLVWCCA